jgi:anti-sigma B factor antagonist
MDPTNSGISVQQENDVTIATLNYGHILMEEHIREIDKSIMPLIEQARCPNLVLDFSHVRYMSSAFLGLLVRIHKRICERNGRLTLRNMDRNIYRAFETTKLNKVIDIRRKHN